jgi:hypothetical protein
MSQTGFLGDPGERLAAAALWLAMMGEVHPATSNDDDDKVDHRLVYTCPFSLQRRELRCQVKTGNSFGEWTKTKNRYRIDLDPKFRQRLQTNDAPTLLVWIPESNRTILYGLIPARRNIHESIYINLHSEITPAALFDIARQHIIFSRLPRSRQIMFTPSETVADAFKKKSHRKRLSFAKPKVARNLDLPNAALRHVTRNSRSSVRRRLSLDVYKFLPQILQFAPNSVQCLEMTTHTPADSNCRSQSESLLLLTYPAAFKSSTQKEYSLSVRIRERISFPSNWMTSLLCLDGRHEGTVQSRATIETWYLKSKNG